MNNHESPRVTKPASIDNLIAERAETVAALRKQFHAHGFDVAAYSDDAVSAAMRADTDSDNHLAPAGRLALAFKHLAKRSA